MLPSRLPSGTPQSAKYLGNDLGKCVEYKVKHENKKFFGILSVSALYLLSDLVDYIQVWQAPICSELISIVPNFRQSHDYMILISEIYNLQPHCFNRLGYFSAGD